MYACDSGVCDMCCSCSTNFRYSPKWKAIVNYENYGVISILVLILFLLHNSSSPSEFIISSSVYSMFHVKLWQKSYCIHITFRTLYRELRKIYYDLKYELKAEQIQNRLRKISDRILAKKKFIFDILILFDLYSWIESTCCPT